MLEALLESAWLGPAVWAAVYVSDNALTIACARLYRAQDHIVFEGSYEITPLFQLDVDGLKRFSPRFIVMLAASIAYLSFVRYVADTLIGRPLYAGVLGALLLLQAAVHVRHLRNWFLLKRTGTIQGRILYPRGLTLRMSAFELLLFAVLYSMLFEVTRSVFILGGAMACAVVALKHYRLARRVPASGSMPA